MQTDWFKNPETNLILLIPMVSWFAVCLDIIAPALPLIVDEFDVSSGLLQNTMSLFLLVCGFTQLLIRRCLIWLGHKYLTIICYLFIIIGCLMGAAANDLNSLIIARCFQAMGSSGTLMVSFLAIRDITSNETIRTRLCSYLSTAIAISPVLIPAIGAYITQTNHWHFTFVCVGSLIFLHGLLTFYLFPNGNVDNRIDHQKKSKWLDLFNEHSYLGYLLLSGILGGTTNFLFLSHSAYIYIVHFKTSAMFYGYLFSIVGIIYMLGCFLFPWLEKKYGNIQAIILGHMLVLLSASCILFFTFINVLNSILFTSLVCLAHLGSGFLLTGSIVGLMSHPTLARDQVIGVYGCIKFAIPAVIGLMSMFFGASLFAMSSTLITIATLVILAIIPIISAGELYAFPSNQGSESLGTNN